MLRRGRDAHERVDLGRQEKQRKMDLKQRMEVKWVQREKQK